MNEHLRGLLVALALATAACDAGGDDPRPSDAPPISGVDVEVDAAADAAGPGDGGAEADAPGADGITPDDGPPAPDTTQPDAPAADADAAPDDGPPADADATPDADVAPDGGDAGPTTTAFGAIAGACGALTAELESAAPSVWHQTYTFDGGAFDYDALGAGGQTLFDTPNAGGSSACSEVFSMEVLEACEGAELYKTETEIVYTAEGSLTDYEVLIGGDKVGVSVTRAYKGPVTEYTLADATGLLTKKLEGVSESTAHVSADDLWVKQILHVWTLHADWAELVAAAWQELPTDLKADTIVLITVEAGSDFVVTDTCDE